MNWKNNKVNDKDFIAHWEIVHTSFYRLDKKIRDWKMQRKIQVNS